MTDPGTRPASNECPHRVELGVGMHNALTNGRRPSSATCELCLYRGDNRCMPRLIGASKMMQERKPFLRIMLTWFPMRRTLRPKPWICALPMVMRSMKVKNQTDKTGKTRRMSSFFATRRCSVSERVGSRSEPWVVEAAWSELATVRVSHDPIVLRSRLQVKDMRTGPCLLKSKSPYNTSPILRVAARVVDFAVSQ